MKKPFENYLSKKTPKQKQSIVDHWSMQTFSLVAGSLLDVFYGDLGFKGVLISRGEGFIANTKTAGPYGRWRDKWYKWTKTDENASWLRKLFPETLAFETFQVPMYATVVTIATVGEQLIEGVDKESLEYVMTADYKDIFNYALNQGKEGLIGAAKWSVPMMYASKLTANKFRDWYDIKRPEQKVEKDYQHTSTN